MGNNSKEAYIDDFHRNKNSGTRSFVTLCSGSGSNFKAILESIAKGELEAKPLAVISNNPKAKALEIGKSFGVNQFILDHSSDAENNLSLSSTLDEISPDFIILAGYIKLLPHHIVKRYQGRILNIHPSLLPKYGGKGMYGINVHKQVIINKDKISGATVHFVTEEYDQGDIIAQEQVYVENTDTPETLAAKVLKIEHKLYPNAIKLFLKSTFLTNDKQ